MTNPNDLPSLTPPEPLQAPAAVPQVSPEQSGEMVHLTPEQRSKLDQMAQEFVQGLLTADPNGPEFKRKSDTLHNLGGQDIRAAANVSNRMLDRPIKATKSGLYDENSTVTKGLMDLRRTVEALDPSRQGGALSPRKLLGMIPMGRKVDDYFMKYQSAQGHLNAILETLYRSQDELRKDNASIEQEKVNLWNAMQRLRQHAYVGRAVDDALSRRIAEIEATDPDKARVVKEELLFAVRQRVTDVLTQLAVSVQGYMALDLVRRNNLELIKGVDRATSTTVSALRTAVVVSQALVNQKLVLDQVTALNTTTGNMIEGTSRMLREQSAAIHQQAGSATINLDQLKASFDNVYAALDQISDFKAQALDNFSRTINTLQGEVDGAQRRLDRVRNELAEDATRDLNVQGRTRDDLSL
ncbi:toxic anion resistance protein [Deinococcus ficus]|jgi:uncharacterized protein YaaN involved in tellurite resistance|uniref:toxic anion resistance protein n=1 Tax=Deinococcus ficus TaxID=317577 RepID=UPI00041BEBDF|nr:toxic anion resistance protein [Deinococcus ficus]